jgi:DNA-binding response OmpR family regulator
MFLPSASGAARRLGAAAGVDDFLPFPFSIAELLARLRAWTKPPGVPPPAAAAPDLDGRVARP